ncbi:hypothetical protein DVS77_34360 [Mycolicibacterium moriokaense]|nr:hypothetical protein DVS77_34360 [Mycolicibacterium moriokaense]
MSDAVTVEAGPWLVLADASVGTDVARAMGERVRVDIASATILADDAAGPTLLDSLGRAANVLYAPFISPESFDAESAQLLFGAARRLTAALSTMAAPPRLFVLTPETGPGVDDNPAQAILWGLGRMLAIAHPGIWGGILELDGSAVSQKDGTAAGNTDDDSVQALGEIKDIWRACDATLRRSLLKDHVGVLVAAVMGLPSAKALNPSADFFELGMDSLMSVLLQRALAETLGEMLDQSVVFDYPTVEELAEYLATIADADQELAEANSERVN